MEAVLSIGDVLLYEYDFGSMIEIVLSVVNEIARTKQREKVQLLARNVLAEETCDECSAPATYEDIVEGTTFCDKCAESAFDDGMLLLITNSPRSGECGYDGELDIWTVCPRRSFPRKR